MVGVGVDRGWPRVLPEGGLAMLAGVSGGDWTGFVLVGSLTISYGRKRNVGGSVLRNFPRGEFNGYMADTFREKMLPGRFCLFGMIDWCVNMFSSIQA